MAEPTGEVDERGLALLVDTVQVGLEQYTPPSAQQPLGLRGRGRDQSARMALGIARARAHRRFHDKLGSVVAGQECSECLLGALAWLDETAGHHGDARTAELGKIVLVGIPTNDR